jgi:glycosyltransferase involved in cell wall biosynthesis
MASFSVVITCYNHGQYLAQAIESVNNQHFDEVETIVVDDGSTDETADVATRFPCVQYLWQENNGLSSARNAGLRAAKTDYIVFLDADDWLLPGALEVADAQVKANPLASIIVGGYVPVWETGSGYEYGDAYAPHFGRDPYAALLLRNVVHMHAAVVYRRDVLEDVGGFDERLDAAEDYDVLLRIARDCERPIQPHSAPVAAYRKYRHNENMSGDPAKMLKAHLEVVGRHRSYIDRNPQYARAFKTGIQNCKDYYGSLLLRRLKESLASAPMKKNTQKDAAVVVRHIPVWTVKRLLRRTAQSVIPSKVKRLIRRAVGAAVVNPPPGEVDWGDLRTTNPMSRAFGFDRGTPVDRYYIEGFLEDYQHDIQGRVLEIGERTYTKRFGKDDVTQSNVLHYTDDNPDADFVGDLTDAPHLPSDTFDCIILTETLQLIYDVRAALSTLYRILRPGGVLLLTVPGLTPTPPSYIGEGWYWSFTDKSMYKLLEEYFPASHINVEAYGNVLSAIAMLEGIAQEELTISELDPRDGAYQVTVIARAQKPA